MKETFGQYIRLLRNSKDFTLTQLGAKLGIDSGALSKIETGKKIFDDKLLKKLAEIFNLDINTVRNEYYSEVIAKILVEKECSDEIVVMATNKARYLRNKNIVQSTLNFLNDSSF